jgi:MoaA/NifB/PqqE/SkfB family radical SAM enzyme
MIATNQQRFKRNVRMVEIEPHSFCNRKCWFCPNKFIDLDRSGPVQWLDEFVYDRILSDLAYICYDGAISFSGYCEPFSLDIEFLNRVAQARAHLPNAFLMANTNTDYLTPEILKKAAEAGLNLIKAQLYFEKEEEFCHARINQKAFSLIARLPGIGFKQVIKDNWYAKVDNMAVYAYAKNWHKVGFNRCDIQLRKTQRRFHVCCEPIQYVGINYNGIVTPCCHLRSDYLPYEKLMLGRLDATPGLIFQLYQGMVLPNDYPCQLCPGKKNHVDEKLVYTKVLKEL